MKQIKRDNGVVEVEDDYILVEGEVEVSPEDVVGDEGTKKEGEEGSDSGDDELEKEDEEDDDSGDDDDLDE